MERVAWSRHRKKYGSFIFWETKSLSPWWVSSSYCFAEPQLKVLEVFTSHKTVVYPVHTTSSHLHSPIFTPISFFSSRFFFSVAPSFVSQTTMLSVVDFCELRVCAQCFDLCCLLISPQHWVRHSKVRTFIWGGSITDKMWRNEKRASTVQETLKTIFLFIKFISATSK